MRPYIICHMLSSVGGKIDGTALGAVTGDGEYEATAAKLNGDAWICGRTTMREARRDRSIIGEVVSFLITLFHCVMYTASRHEIPAHQG